MKLFDVIMIGERVDKFIKLKRFQIGNAGFYWVMVKRIFWKQNTYRYMTMEGSLAKYRITLYSLWPHYIFFGTRKGYFIQFQKLKNIIWLKFYIFRAASPFSKVQKNTTTELFYTFEIVVNCIFLNWGTLPSDPLSQVS